MYKEILKLNEKKTSSFYNEPKLSQADHQRSGRWQMSTRSDAPHQTSSRRSRKTGSAAHLLEWSELGPPRLPKAGGNSLAVSYKTKYNLAIRSHSHTPCDFFTKRRTCLHKICTQLFGHLFTVAKTKSNQDIFQSVNG